MFPATVDHGTVEQVKKKKEKKKIKASYDAHSNWEPEI